MRILSSLFIILAVFVATTVLVKVNVSGCRLEFLVGTLACVAVVSGASNIFSGSMFGISGHFPMRISQALISGQSRDVFQHFSTPILCLSVLKLKEFNSESVHEFMLAFVAKLDNKRQIYETLCTFH